ncbi:MAG: tripartite tricarboxylate transporter substrate binding protein [Betaproteobacteria bacterium]|nr:tripartite tricarboxylate transporter substrate binding protein [Betaproteobacteria bacterium]
MARLMRSFCLGVAALLCFMPALAADYPTKPVTLVLAFPPGGPADVLGRTIGKKAGDLLGQTFIIENRPGAGGNIAAEHAARAAPDGYTLLLGDQSSLVANASLYKKLNYDSSRDFAPIAFIGTQANILIVHPSVPANTVSELVALAKANPGKLNFASGGYGVASHLSGELFKSRAGINIVHVAYKGTGPATQDLLAGRVQISFPASTSVIGHIKSGKVRALAVTTAKRTAILPDIPTVAESGLPGFDLATWHGIVAPAATPKDILATLERTIVAALRDPAVREALTKIGEDVVAGSQEEFAAFIKSETPKWRAIVKLSGAQLD